MCPDILWPFAGAHKTATFSFIAPLDSHLPVILSFFFFFCSLDKSCENMRAKVLHCHTKETARPQNFRHNFFLHLHKYAGCHININSPARSRTRARSPDLCGFKCRLSGLLGLDQRPLSIFKSQRVKVTKGPNSPKKKQDKVKTTGQS